MRYPSSSRSNNTARYRSAATGTNQAVRFVPTTPAPLTLQVAADKISRGGSADAHFFGVADAEGRVLSLDGLRSLELRCVYASFPPRLKRHANGLYRRLHARV